MNSCNKKNVIDKTRKGGGGVHCQRQIKLLETSHCFVCSLRTTETENIYSFSLQTLLQCLKVNLTDVIHGLDSENRKLLEELEKGEETSSRGGADKPEMNVRLCQSCWRTTEKTAELFRLLEKLQLEIDHRIEKINEEMSKVFRVPNSSRRTIKSEDASSMNTFALVDELRRGILKHSSNMKYALQNSSVDLSRIPAVIPNQVGVKKEKNDLLSDSEEPEPEPPLLISFDDIETSYGEDENSNFSEEPPILVPSAGKSTTTKNDYDDDETESLENIDEKRKPFRMMMDEEDEEEGIDIDIKFNYNHDQYVTGEDEGELEEENDLAEAATSEVKEELEEENLADNASSSPMPNTPDDDAQFDYSMNGMELHPEVEMQMEEEEEEINESDSSMPHHYNYQNLIIECISEEEEEKAEGSTSDSSNIQINYHPSIFHVNGSSKNSNEVSNQPPNHKNQQQEQVQPSSSFSSYSSTSLMLLSQVAVSRSDGVSSAIAGSSSAAISATPLPPPTVTVPNKIKKAKTPKKVRPRKISLTHTGFKRQSNKNKEGPRLNCLCKHCGKLFKTPSTLINHYRRVHQNFRKFRCDLCDLRFWEVTLLRIHKNRVHSTTVPCEGCNRHFPQGSLSKHLEECGHYIKIQERKHKEQDIPMISNDEAVAMSNILSITNQHGMPNDRKYVFVKETGKYRCTSCPRQYESFTGVIHHYESLHLKILHRCDLCIKEFKYKHTLEAHRRREHDVGTADLKHDCNICGKKFFTAFNMKRHKNTVHLKIRNYPCDLCDKVYKEPGTLKDHRRKTHLTYFDPLSFTLEVPTTTMMTTMAAVAGQRTVASGSGVRIQRVITSDSNESSRSSISDYDNSITFMVPPN